MMYTIEDLRGKYVKAGTAECKVFLDACESIDVKWVDGSGARQIKGSCTYILVNTDNDRIFHCSNHPLMLAMKYEPFTPKPQWTPETNNLKREELSSSQYGELKRLADDGRPVYRIHRDNLVWVRVEMLNPVFEDGYIYRIKPNSPRDAVC